MESKAFFGRPSFSLLTEKCGLLTNSFKPFQRDAVEARIGSLLGVSTAGIAALRTELKDVRSQVWLTFAIIVGIYGSVSGRLQTLHANTGDLIFLYFRSVHTVKLSFLSFSYNFGSALVLIRILQIPYVIADPDPVFHHTGSNFFCLKVPVLYLSTKVLGKMFCFKKANVGTWYPL